MLRRFCELNKHFRCILVNYCHFLANFQIIRKANYNVANRFLFPFLFYARPTLYNQNNCSDPLCRRTIPNWHIGITQGKKNE